uniref:peptidylprolyl isomerase n=1 Tax=Robiginitalea biformata TaxID=252307 RepID=UPI003D3463CD
ITHVPTHLLDGKHTVFGHVASGQEVVDSIAQGDRIETLEIVRVGDAAESWDALAAFVEFRVAARKKEEAAKAEMEQQLESH